MLFTTGVDFNESSDTSSEIARIKKYYFFGTLDYYPNIDGLIWFISKILPTIWASDQTIQFVVAGRNPPDGLKKLHTIIELP
ncbi:MAG: hypothetical protein U0V48_02190 [Anaerolineales bacterium]